MSACSKSQKQEGGLAAALLLTIWLFGSGEPDRDVLP